MIDAQDRQGCTLIGDTYHLIIRTLCSTVCTEWRAGSDQFFQERSMKFIIGIIIGILVIIFMVQNVEVVEITFLPWSIHLPRAIMILIVFVLGMGAGYVVRGVRSRKKRRESLQET
jgi:uncharacterized integral membrane protein